MAKTIVTEDHINAFKSHCVKKPNNILNTDELQKQWAPGFFEHTVDERESLKSIARYYLIDKKAPHGFDWKWLCRFNFGVDYPPYVNYRLIEEFGLDLTDEAEINKNRTEDHKNYSFKGGEKLQIPLRAGASKPGSICPNTKNVIGRGTIKITSVKGPAFVTADIASNFAVTGYSVDKRDVTQTKKDSVRWWITNITKKEVGEADDRGSIHELSKLKGEDSGETKEKTQLTIAQADVTSAKYRIGDWIRMYPYFGEKANINLLVYVQFRLIEVELKHDIPRTEIEGGVIAANDPINKIHNPAVVIIGAKTEQTCAKFQLTKVTSDEKKDDNGDTVNDADGNPIMIPAISVNDEGFIWKTKPIPGKATFVKIENLPENKGSDCLVYGREPGYIRLEGWCLEAEKCCVSKILKVVNEREIRFRVNLLTSIAFPLANTVTVTGGAVAGGATVGGTTTGGTITGGTWAIGGVVRPAPTGPGVVFTGGTTTGGVTTGGNLKYTTNETVASLQAIFSVQNIYLRQVGIKLVPDNNAATGEVIATEVVTRDSPGYFKVTDVDDQYVRIPGGGDILATSKINAVANVANYVIVHNITGFHGYAPTAMRNLHTQPTAGRGTAVTGMLDTFTGPDEVTVWLDSQNKFDDADIDDVSKTKSLKKMKMFPTPDTNPGHENLGGVLISMSVGPGAAKTAAELTYAGALYAHELGHVVSIQHRGGDGSTPDLLPASRKNTMFWNYNGNPGRYPADWDLIQADVFRGCILCSRDSNKGNLEIKAFTHPKNAVSGANGSEKTFNLEVTRKGKKVAGAFLNFWIEEKRTAIEIKQVDNWEKTTRIMSTGLAKIKIKFTTPPPTNPPTPPVAKLVIMAGDNDDLVKLEITCTVT